MIDILKEIEETIILELLSNSEIWNSYEEKTPRVEKIFTDINFNGKQYRLLFHYNHVCSDMETEYHSHPHKLAIHVIDGVYEMGIGTEKKTPYSEGFLFNNTLCKIECYGGMYYEMTDKEGFHYVKPIGSKTKSVMIQENPKDVYNEQLSDERKEKIRKWFYKYYYKMETLS